MRKFLRLTCIVIDLEVLDDGPIFSHCQERGSIIYLFICFIYFILFIYLTKEAKATKYNFVYIQTAFLKSTQPLKWDSMPWQSVVITK